jgi:glycosyltransferase involved in cell wall biosynthesis
LRRVNPSMPYYDPERPFVNTWFSSTDGSDANAFCHHLREGCQDQLEQEGGVCIVHTHLACGFADRGRVRPVVERLLRRLALKNGWFVPVSTLLDFLREQRQSVSIPQAEIRAMEHRWLADQLLGSVGRQTHRLSDALRPQSSPWSSQVAVSPVDHRPRVVHMTSAHSAFDSRIFHKECKSLARAGYETYQLATHSEDAAVDRVYIRGMSRSSGRLHRMSIRLLSFGYEALRLKGNIYHIHEPELLAVGLALRACGKSVIYDVHEDLPRTILYKHYIAERLRRPLARLAEYLETVAARRLSGIVAATPVIAARFTEINANTIVVKNYPIADELTATRTEWSQRPLSVAYIGGISEERGIRELLKAMAELKHPNARLELAGHFVVKALHHELATTPEWQYVNWRGQLDRRELARLLGSVRAGLVVLRPTENFVHSLPIKLFEYMAAGIPVIASDFPLWRAIIEEAVCGILVTPNDPASIAEAIHYLLTHDSEASAMGERGRAAVEDKFNWAREERKLLSLYGSLFQSYGAECASVNRSC